MGNFLQGKFHGFGVFKSKDQNVSEYVGMWKSNNREGWGRVYEGGRIKFDEEFANNTRLNKSGISLNQSNNSKIVEVNTGGDVNAINKGSPNKITRNVNNSQSDYDAVKAKK